MLTPHEFATLERLAALHHRSLPTYLTYAQPWVRFGNEAGRQVIEDIAADHHQLVEKVLRMLEEDDRPVALGDFPMAYTDLNDLSLDFILQELIRYERRLIRTLEEMLRQLAPERVPHGIVDHAVGMAMGHLHNLEESSGATPTMRP